MPASGWAIEGTMEDCHHGEYSILMERLCDCQVVGCVRNIGAGLNADRWGRVTPIACVRGVSSSSFSFRQRKNANAPRVREYTKGQATHTLWIYGCALRGAIMFA